MDTAACNSAARMPSGSGRWFTRNFTAGLSCRDAPAYLPFPQAPPKKGSAIERALTPPCTGDCPAGIKAHGYVSLDP